MTFHKLICSLKKIRSLYSHCTLSNKNPLISHLTHKFSTAIRDSDPGQWGGYCCQTILKKSTTAANGRRSFSSKRSAMTIKNIYKYRKIYNTCTSLCLILYLYFVMKEKDWELKVCLLGLECNLKHQQEREHYMSSNIPFIFLSCQIYLYLIKDQ